MAMPWKSWHNFHYCIKCETHLRLRSATPRFCRRLTQRVFVCQAHSDKADGPTSTGFSSPAGQQDSQPLQQGSESIQTGPNPAGQHESSQAKDADNGPSGNSTASLADSVGAQGSNQPPRPTPHDVFDVAWAAAAAAGDVQAGKHVSFLPESMNGPNASGLPAAAVAASGAGGQGTVHAVRVPPGLQLGHQENPAWASLAQRSVEEMQLDLIAVARNYQLVSLGMFALGAVLTLAPSQFVSAALHEVEVIGVEAIFARLMGVALLFRGLLALVLKVGATEGHRGRDQRVLLLHGTNIAGLVITAPLLAIIAGDVNSAAEVGRLDSTTSQRVILGCILPCISHYVAFKSIVSQWGATWNGWLMLLYPTLLGAEFYTHMMAFQVYNPLFLMKMLWPVAAGLLISALFPPLPALHFDVPLPRAVTPVTAGVALVLSHSGVRWFSRVVGKAVSNYTRKQLVSKVFSKVFSKGGPTLTGTVVRKMDFLLPSTSLAWGYWFMMLNHFGTMLHAYVPDHLFVGTVTPVSCLLKQSWSAGFLAAAFACGALKTAGDRHHLVLQENRQINLCLAFLEAAFAGCLAWGLANGVVAASPYSYFRLATAVAAVLFVMAVWWKTGQEAAAKGYPVEPSVSSIDWQQATEKRADYQRITSFAVVALNVITSCI